MKDINLIFTQTVSITIDMKEIYPSKAVANGQGALMVPLGYMIDQQA